MNMERAFKTVVGVFACILVGGVFVLVATIFSLRGESGRFRCRTRQAEAKVNLSGLFLAEKSFYGEYGVYSTDLNAVNWLPDGSPLYVYGFARAGGPAQIKGIDDFDPTRSNTADPRVALDAAGQARFNTAKMKTLKGRALGPQDLAPVALVAASSFVASAAGDIDTDSTEQLDLWTIDEHRQLINLLNDCSQSL